MFRVFPKFDTHMLKKENILALILKKRYNVRNYPKVCFDGSTLFLCSKRTIRIKIGLSEMRCGIQI